MPYCDRMNFHNPALGQLILHNEVSIKDTNENKILGCWLLFRPVMLSDRWQIHQKSCPSPPPLHLTQHITMNVLENNAVLVHRTHMWSYYLSFHLISKTQEWWSAYDEVLSQIQNITIFITIYKKLWRSVLCSHYLLLCGN